MWCGSSGSSSEPHSKDECGVHRASSSSLSSYIALGNAQEGEQNVFVLIEVNIISFSGEAFPPGSPLKLEVRDTSTQDVAAIVLKQVQASVPKADRTTAVTVTLEVATVPDGTTVWAHIDVDRDGRVSKGDFVTVESYPVSPAPTQSLSVRVKKVT